MAKNERQNDTIMYRGKAHRKSPRWARYLIYGLGLLLIGQLFGPWAVISVLALAAAVAFSDWRSAGKTAKAERTFMAVCQQEDVLYKRDYSDPVRGIFLGLAEAEARVLAQFSTNTSMNPCHRIRIDVKRVLNVELSVNDEAIYKAGPVATLAGAAAGGLAFGGFGAIAGALGTTRSGAGKISAVMLKLRMDDIDRPLAEVSFLLDPAKASSADTQARVALAEKWTNLVEILRHRSKNSPIVEPSLTRV